jgi:hypothetical protein
MELIALKWSLCLKFYAQKDDSPLRYLRHVVIQKLINVSHVFTVSTIRVIM